MAVQSGRRADPAFSEGVNEMKKTACYLATRNVYPQVAPSLKSLLKNGGVDRVYILAEDGDLGYDLPSKVIVKNISGWREQLLDPDGPNYNCKWTWMVMMKAALCKFFPEERMLSLDMDTAVRGDLSELWDMDLEGYYFAGAREPFWTKRYGRDYVNAGVLMWNLEMMRDGTAEKALRAMNGIKYTFVEQDCLNEICAGKIKVIDAAYNAGDWTEPPGSEIRIRHYMASKGTWKAEPEIRGYAAMDWEEVFR